MDEKIERLLQSPYWIIDILPKQVPKDSSGQFFAVEKYYLEGNRLAEIKQKHINIILKLNCYQEIRIAGEETVNPAPEHLEEEMLKRSLYIMTGESMILSEPDAAYLTLFDPDENLLELIRMLAAGEGLFVWKPPASKESRKQRN